MFKKYVLIILLGVFVFSASVLLCSGCKSQSTDQTEETEKSSDEGTELSEEGGQPVLMLGRSVMGSWFEHWVGHSYGMEQPPVKRNGFTFYYGDVEVPPKIVDSSSEYINKYEDKKPIVFFKLGFDDFWATSSSEIKKNLAENKKYVEQIYEIVVKEKGLKLIIGNALPKVASYTDDDLVRNEREYNSWLNDFADSHPGEVYVFDQYDILTNKDGSLKAEYAVDSEDSHLNDAAYSTLDGPFFELLKDNF